MSGYEEFRRAGNLGAGRRRLRTMMRTTPATTRTLIALLAVLAVLAGACSSESTDNTFATTIVPVETTPPSVGPEPEPSGEGGTAPSTGDGWIDGEPDWHKAPDETALAAEAAPSTGDGWIEEEPDWYDSDTSGEAAVAEAAPAEKAMAEPAMEEEAFEMAVEELAASAVAAPTTTGAPPEQPPEQPQERLTGGSIDDNDRFEDYLAYRSDFFRLGIPVRDIDPSGRIVVTVTGEGGLPVAGVEVLVAAGQRGVGLRTTADGTVRFHPEAYELGAGPFTVSVGGVSAEAAPGESVALETSLPTASGETVALDVLFLLDSTGSMDDEIYQLKITIDEVARRIHQLPGNVDVRLGMTLYRDEFDSFLTSTFDLTPDIEAFAGALAMVVADGGDDYPEALDEALADALAKPSWRPPSETVQLVFLVADAPPQVLRQVPVPYPDSMREAARRGIKIFPVSSSGTDDQAEFVFRQLAQFTGARYVFLTYGAEGRATGATTDIDQRDYEELSLDDLIVRLVAEELADLLGPTETPEDDQ